MTKVDKVNKSKSSKPLFFVDVAICIFSFTCGVWMVGDVLKSFVLSNFDFFFYSHSVFAISFMLLGYSFGMRAVKFDV